MNTSTCDTNQSKSHPTTEDFPLSAANSLYHLKAQDAVANYYAIEALEKLEVYSPTQKQIDSIESVILSAIQFTS